VTKFFEVSLDVGPRKSVEFAEEVRPPKEWCKATRRWSFVCRGIVEEESVAGRRSWEVEAIGEKGESWWCTWVVSRLWNTIGVPFVEGVEGPNQRDVQGKFEIQIREYREQKGGAEVR
jgi:hypothetical protein